MRSSSPIQQWREDVGRRLINLDFEPWNDAPFRAQFKVLAAHDNAQVVEFNHSPGRTFRDQELSRDGYDSMAMVLPFGSRVRVVQGLEYELRPGQAAFVESLEPGSIGSDVNVRFIAVMVPRLALRKCGIVEGELVRRAWTGINQPLRLLRNYLSYLYRNPITDGAHLQEAATAHIRELALLSAKQEACSQRRATEELATARSAGWRLQLAKYFIESKFEDPNLSVADVAANQNISVRYLQYLFEAAGIHFASYVNELRLNKARRDLCDPAQCGRPVADIAFASGFGDISHFNRLFRKRYDMTPTSARALTAAPKH